MAKIQIQPDWDLPTISAAAGADHSEAYRVKNEFFCPDVSQAALDAALAGYDHNAIIKKQLKDELYRVVEEKQEALSDPLDDLTLTVITGLQGDRARGKPLTPQQQAILDAGDTDPRRQQVEDLLVAAKSIRADIESGVITPLDDIRNDSRWNI
jgi:hypothetical protein